MWPALILQYGLPLAYKIWQTFSTKTDPTEADWQTLLDLANKNADQYLAEARQKAVAATVPPPAP